MDLEGAGGEFRWNIFYWPRVLRLAQDHGWQPAGTLLESDGAWEGGYGSNDFQLVTAEDARNLADALERALEAIPDEDTMAAVRNAEDEIDVEELENTEREFDPTDWLSGSEGKEYLTRFIAFCRAGEFTIG